ncbi:MAG: ferritin family protein [Alphaproteobacteria bacterium]|nr:ferritin family protein [Alphaproteobacteria bacterium]
MREVHSNRLTGLTTVKQILDTATQFEIVARDFYTALIPKVSKNLRYLAEELAEEEQGHVDLFQKLANDPTVIGLMEEKIARPVSDGRFTDGVQKPDLGDNPDDQTVLQFAVMRETDAMEQYSALAKMAPEGPLRTAFEFLANEEAEHKQELEKLYYEIVHSGGV